MRSAPATTRTSSAAGAGSGLRLLLLTAAFPSRTEPSRAPYMLDLARALAQRHRVTVLAPRVHPEDPRCEVAEGVRTVRFDHGARGRRLKPLGARAPHLLLLRYAASAVSACRHLARQADLVYAHWLLPSGFVARVALACSRTPLVVHLHGSDVERYAARSRLWGCLGRSALRRAGAVLAANDGLAGWARESGGEARIEVVPMGVDPDRFLPPTAEQRAAARARLGLPADVRVIVFAGDPVAAKGLPELKEAVSALGTGHTLLIAGGTTPCSAGFQPAAAGWKPALQPVIPLGPVPHAHMPQILHAADALALPSRAEGAPLAVAEALACGLPVVATRVGAIGDLVGPGGADLLLDPTEGPPLVAALVPALRRALLRGGRSADARVPTLQDCVMRIDRTLSSVHAAGTR